MLITVIYRVSDPYIRLGYICIHLMNIHIHLMYIDIHVLMIYNTCISIYIRCISISSRVYLYTSDVYGIPRLYMDNHVMLSIYTTCIYLLIICISCVIFTCRYQISYNHNKSTSPTYQQTSLLKLLSRDIFRAFLRVSR